MKTIFLLFAISLLAQQKQNHSWPNPHDFLVPPKRNEAPLFKAIYNDDVQLARKLISGGVLKGSARQPKKSGVWKAVWQPRMAALRVHAYLFYSKTGQLSKDILAEGGPQIGNTIVDSISTLVVVEVTFDPHSAIPENAKARLVAIESGESPFAANGKDRHRRNRTILDKMSRIGSADNKGVSYVGFWLDGTGCNVITLKASIVGSKAPPVTKLLQFACYE